MNRTPFMRLISAAIAIVLAAALLVPGVSAAVADADAGITAEKDKITAEAPAVPTVTLSDIDSDDWFYGEVNRLVEKGIINGFPDGTFRPEKDVSVAEFVKILLLSIGEAPYTAPPAEPTEDTEDDTADDTTDESGESEETAPPSSDAEAEPADEEKLVADTVGSIFPESWASPYLNKAYDLGLITDSELDGGIEPDAPISRGFMAQLTAKALHIMPAYIENPFNDKADAWALAVYDRYLIKGIPNEDGTLSFRADSFTRRSEAAVMAVRILDYSADPYEYIKNTVLTDAAEGYTDTESGLIDLFYILNREFMTGFTFNTIVPPATWVEYYQRANALHLEYFYSSYVDCSYAPQSTTYTIRIAYDTDIEILKGYLAEAEAKADAVIAELITEDMSSIEKAAAIHDYLILNCKYDIVSYNSGAIPFESRIPYGALVKGEAVCQGYAAAFNMLCRRAGVMVAVVTGTAPGSPDLHAWNMVLIDGKIYYVDATHDDPVPDVEGYASRKYFMLSAEELLSLGYVWDRSQARVEYFY